MLLARVKLKNCCGITDDIEFPEVGTLTVVGENGSGKTVRVLDAPAWAAWGSTLRGTPPTTGSTHTEVALITDKVEIIRSTKNPKLEWRHHGTVPPIYETPTKQKEALLRVTGPMDTWCRTHVFTSLDAAIFSTATDGERKRLLEKLIGLHVFDAAYKIISDSTSSRLNSVTDIRNKIVRLEERMAEIGRHAKDLRAFFDQSDSGDPEKMQAEQMELAQKRQGFQEEYQRASAEIAQARAQLSMVQSQQLQHQNGQCYACKQNIPHALLEQQQADLATAIRSANEAEVRNRVAMQDAAQAMSDIDYKLQNLNERINRTGSYQLVVDKLAALKLRYKEEQQQHASLQFDLSLYEEDEEVQRHASRMLGLKGPRARILARSLSALEVLANSYMEWLNSDTRLVLHGSADQANGKPSEKITIEVVGYGGGHGYDGASGGERRRIDMALLLAIANLSKSKGTLIFDEVFDALDNEGVRSACELLTRISEKRPIIVITHNPELVLGLRGPKLTFARPVTITV